MSRFCILIIVLFTFLAAAYAADFKVNPPNQTVDIGDAVDIRIYADGINNFAGFQFNFEYDDSILSFNDVIAFHQETNPLGTVSQVYCTLQGDWVLGAGDLGRKRISNIFCVRTATGAGSSSGPVAILKFTAIAEGQSPADIKQDSVKISDPDANPIAGVSIGDGQVIVSQASEICTNGIDDDDDGDIDCLDSGCPVSATPISCNSLCQELKCTPPSPGSADPTFGWYCDNKSSSTSCGTLLCPADGCSGTGSNIAVTFLDNCTRFCSGLGVCQICACLPASTEDCGKDKYCSSGSCSSCTGSLKNCDRDSSSTGCEVDTSTDNAHCGSCDNQCPTDQHCESSICVVNPVCTSPSQCDDSNPCTINDCVSGFCSYSNEVAGTVCSQDDSCDGTQRCDVKTCNGSGSCSIKSQCTECPDSYGVCGEPLCSDVACTNTINDGDMCGTMNCGAGASGSCDKTCNVLGGCDDCTLTCTETNCSDGLDNDNDGDTDDDDLDCTECIGETDLSSCSSGSCCNEACYSEPSCSGDCENDSYVCLVSGGLSCGFESPGTSCNDNNLCTTIDVCGGSGSCSGTEITFGPNTYCLEGQPECETAYIDCDSSKANGCEALQSEGCGSCVGGQTKSCIISSCTGVQVCESGSWGTCILPQGVCTAGSTKSCNPIIGTKVCFSLTSSQTCNSCGSGWGACTVPPGFECCPYEEETCDKSGCLGTRTCSDVGVWDSCNTSGPCTPIECTSDFNCSGGKICDLGRCVQPECRVDTDCNADEECAGNECESIDCPSGSSAREHRCMTDCLGSICGGTCRAEEGICCNNFWNAGFEVCSLEEVSLLESLAEETGDEKASEYLETARRTISQGNLLKARAEANIGIVYAKIALAKEERKDVSKAVAVLSDAEDALLENTYDLAEQKAQEALDAVGGLDLTLLFIAAGGFVILVVLGLIVFILIKKGVLGKEQDFPEEFETKKKPKKKQKKDKLSLLKDKVASFSQESVKVPDQKEVEIQDMPSIEDEPEEPEEEESIIPIVDEPDKLVAISEKDNNPDLKETPDEGDLLRELEVFDFDKSLKKEKYVPNKTKKSSLGFEEEIEEPTKESNKDNVDPMQELDSLFGIGEKETPKQTKKTTIMDENDEGPPKVILETEETPKSFEQKPMPVKEAKQEPNKKYDVKKLKEELKKILKGEI